VAQTQNYITGYPSFILYTKDNKEGYEYKAVDRDHESMGRWVQNVTRKILANDARKIKYGT